MTSEKATKDLTKYKRAPRVANAWFQTYDLAHSHAIHNHGLGEPEHGLLHNV